MGMFYQTPDKYRLIRALRPFSYSVAVVNCGLGVVLACIHGESNTLRAVLVVVAGVLLQAACNLVNDYADIVFWKKQSGILVAGVIKQIRLNCLLAICLTVVAIAIGIWLSIQTGWYLLALGTVGVVGGYSYTGYPINYKRLGLGVFATFIFTGVLMVAGSHYAVCGVWDSKVIWISIPVSLLSSALLFSNEIRDYKDDLSCSIRTMTVRIGIGLAKVVYGLLLFMVYPVSLWLSWKGWVNNLLYLLPSLLFIWQPMSLLSRGAGANQLIRLPPLTGRFFLCFGLGFILSVSYGLF
ncbi:MAG: prenyltransferase [Candidatus Endonucleobacter bathymodioli]|uniref:Prenyltransferase n=1 Tax=Candidatus Endonucleibacter bathymodioli TaxID=539814 RepID=A0AA90NKS6_9GAMM|nr:prenyltransferase [Candidatus Endonucleobacter bathymodioli]